MWANIHVCPSTTFSGKLLVNNDLSAAYGSDVQDVTGAAAECPLNVHLELLKHIQRHKSLNSACKSAAMHTAGALAVEGIFSHIQRNGKALVLYIRVRVDVLEVLEGAVAGLLTLERKSSKLPVLRA